MRPRPRRWAPFVAVGLALAGVLTIREASAAPADASVSAQVSQVLSDDYAQASFGEAKRKLTNALEKCRKAGCSGPVKAQALIVLGMTHSQLGQGDEARQSFVNAIGEDPNAKLPATTTPNIRNLWKEAQDKAKPAPPPAEEPAAPAVASPSSGGAAAAPEPPTPSAVVSAPASPSPGGTKIPGWNNVDAYQAAAAGLAADTAGKLDECISHDKESLELEDQPRTRLHLASCEARSGKLLDALADAQKALQAGIKKRDDLLTRAARTRIQDLLTKIPHVTFVPPPNADELTVTFDERPVPVESLTKKFSIDPGKHQVHAEANVNGIPMALDREYTVKPGELVTVALTLEAQKSDVLTPGQLRCMLQAKSQEDVQKCLPQNEKNLVIKAAMDISAYSDTTSVNVISPRINGAISSPTAGWNAGVNYLIDVFTAASPDIVSMASRKYGETRHAVALTGGYKPGLYGVQAGANMSREPDYLSLTGSLAFTADLRDKLVTPRVSIAYTHDTIGYKSLSGPFLRPFNTTEVDAGVTLVMSPTVVLILNASLNLERGDQSKPYRFVPMFDPDIASRLPAGATVALVNSVRTSVRAAEQLPTEKNRYALSARIAKRFSSSTIRIEERLYTDTWSLKATTTDARWVFDAGKKLRIWPHVRIHAQTGVRFYQLAYSVLTEGDTVTLPLYRTGDRELSPLVTATGGGGLRLELSGKGAKTAIGLTVTGDVMYSKYFNILFLSQRLATYGSVGIDAEFE